PKGVFLPGVPVERVLARGQGNDKVRVRVNKRIDRRDEHVATRSVQPYPALIDILVSVWNRVDSYPHGFGLVFRDVQTSRSDDVITAACPSYFGGDSDLPVYKGHAVVGIERRASRHPRALIDPEKGIRFGRHEGLINRTVVGSNMQRSTGNVDGRAG